MNEAYLFNRGNNYQAYHLLGAKPLINQNGQKGYRFSVWAPHAKKISVVGDFNQWMVDMLPLEPLESTGIWTGFSENAVQWQRYKYAITTKTGKVLLKADPFANHGETRPDTASILYDWETDYVWQDETWLKERAKNTFEKPLNIYEMNLGSWRCYADGNYYNYKDIAPQLVDYMLEMGYTAIEFMPLMEYPLDASWGYQVSGFFAPTSRYGTPADLKFLIDALHLAGIKVILDWVPGHFPKDKFALANFDGEALYEYVDSRLGEHKEWGTLVFDYSKKEVQSFLFSSAYYWIKEFHIDGLRVDAVSSMIYLDYGRTEFVTNKYGGNENIEALDFLKTLNKVVHQDFPGVLMIAEESTAFPFVTRKHPKDNLGFDFKWNMGWMHDTLNYMKADYIFRKYRSWQIADSINYAFSENYILPFSHDEVVHGKASLLNKMPGDDWRKFASLRATLMYQIAYPGAVLNFMGYEIGQFIEWKYDKELDWLLLKYKNHQKLQAFVKQLNRVYLGLQALWELDQDEKSFGWLKNDDVKNSVFIFSRQGKNNKEQIIAAFNFTPAVIPMYSFEVPEAGTYQLVFNSDVKEFAGSGYLEEDDILYKTKIEKITGKPQLEIKLPPLCGLYFKDVTEEEKI